MSADRRIERPSQLPDDRECLTWSILERIWFAIGSHQDKRSLDQGMSVLSDGQRAVYASKWYQVEVNNGGLSQFFGNHTGSFVPYLVQGLERIGARVQLEELRNAISVFPRGRVPLTRPEVLHLLGAQDEMRHRALSRIRVSVGELAELEYSYILAHVEEFFRGPARGRRSQLIRWKGESYLPSTFEFCARSARPAQFTTLAFAPEAGMVGRPIVCTEMGFMDKCPNALAGRSLMKVIQDGVGSRPLRVLVLPWKSIPSGPHPEGRNRLRRSLKRGTLRPLLVVR